MSTFEIKHWDGRVLHTVEADSLKAALEALVRGGAVLRRAVLSDAVLRRADLRDADLSGADLSGADLRDADLRRADLSGAVLRGADLRRANLSGAVLRGADLSGAEWEGVPVVANLHTEMLKAIESGGVLDMGAWHTCETTHCRAGWAITLAGAAGKALELGFGSAMAGALITLKSCPWMEKVPNFYASNEAAMADIRACAEKEASL